MKTASWSKELQEEDLLIILDKQVHRNVHG